MFKLFPLKKGKRKLDVNRAILGILPQWNIRQPPLGIACLTSYAKQFGYEIL